MRRIFSWITLFGILLMALSANAETLNFYQCIDTWDEGFQTFQKKNPNLNYVWSEDYYENTAVLAGKLLTHELQSDVLGLSTTNIDIRQVAAKGYFLNLSNSQVIRDIVNQMLPAVSAAVVKDDQIYALPYYVAFDYWEVSEEGWEAAGLSIEEIPQSFPSFLTFIDMWCDRIESEPEPSIHIWNGWDGTVYDSFSYTFLLTEMLINSAAMQMEATGGSLSFQSEEIAVLLERVKETGRRIYELEPAIQASDSVMGYSLFNPVTRPIWPENSDLIVSMRLNDDQPKFVKAIVMYLAVNSATASPAACVELVEDMAATLAYDMKPYLFIDGEPAQKPNYDELLASAKKNVTDTEAQLKDTQLDMYVRDALEEDLASYQIVLENTEKDAARYAVSPGQLADYRQHSSDLYVATPGVFTPGTDAYANVRSLGQRFAEGQLTTEQFLQQLNRMVQMVNMEE